MNDETDHLTQSDSQYTINALSADVPLRSFSCAAHGFFLIASVFGLLTACLIIYFGNTLYISQIQPFAPILTHLITLGVITMSLIGVLFYILPIEFGIEYPKIRYFALWIRALLTIGLISLCYGFVLDSYIGFVISGILLATALILFAAVTIYKVYFHDKSDAILWLFRLALYGLVITVIFGAKLAFSHTANGTSETVDHLITIHIGWGAAIWFALLIIGLARLLLPKWYGAAPYPALCCKTAVPLIYFSMVIASVLVFFDALLLPKIGISLGLISFAVITIHRLKNAQNTASEPTVYYWFTAMVFLLAAVPFVFIDYIYSNTIFTVLFIGGFALTVIHALIVKLLPFPITKKRTTLLIICHIFGVALLIGGIFYPPLAHCGGAAFAVIYLLLLRALLTPARSLIKSN